MEMKRFPGTFEEGIRRLSLEEARKRIAPLVDEKYGRLFLTMAPTEHDVWLLETFPDEILAFRKFMQEEVYPHDENDNEYTWDEIHFGNFSVGFMCALGIHPAEAFSLSTFMRYNLQDFDPSLEKGSK